MHELSVARAVVAEVTAALAAHDEPVVEVVRLRVGRLAGIDPRALDYGFEFARAGTICEEAALVVEPVGVTVMCGPCGVERETDGAHVRCPVCDTPSADIRAGRELTILDVTLRDRDDDIAATPGGIAA